MCALHDSAPRSAPIPSAAERQTHAASFLSNSKHIRTARFLRDRRKAIWTGLVGCLNAGLPPPIPTARHPSSIGSQHQRPVPQLLPWGRALEQLPARSAHPNAISPMLAVGNKNQKVFSAPNESPKQPKPFLTRVRKPTLPSMKPRYFCISILQRKSAR